MARAEPTLKVRIQRVAHGRDLELPRPASRGSAGFDLRAAIELPRTLEPSSRDLIPCGFCIELPAGWEGQVRSRSGLALRDGLVVLNSPGTIDSDYRGEVGVVLINLGQEPVTIERGDRVAQLVIAPVVSAQWVEVGELSESERAAGGFGSTGI